MVELCSCFQEESKKIKCKSCFWNLIDIGKNKKEEYRIFLDPSAPPLIKSPDWESACEEARGESERNFEAKRRRIPQGSTLLQPILQ